MTVVSDHRITPNLIIAGVSKCGTTSLFSYLAAHREICASNIKETLYFVPLVFGNSNLPSVDVYLKHFIHCNSSDAYIMEASPGYYSGGKNLAKAIKDLLGPIRVLMIFREPTSRFFSYFKYMKSHRHIDRNQSIDDYIKTCEIAVHKRTKPGFSDIYAGVYGGFYDEYLDAWHQCFGDNLLITFLDDLKQDRKLYLKNIAVWLDICPHGFAFEQMNIQNKSVFYKNGFFQDIAMSINDSAQTFWRKHPGLKRVLRNLYYRINADGFPDELSEDHKAYLGQIFAPHNQRLRRQLKGLGYENLPSWLQKEHRVS